MSTTADINRSIVEFCRSLYPGEEVVPLSVPRFGGNEKRYLEECIDSTYVSSVGPFVDRFEREMAAFTGARRAVVCVNGTAALHMALILAGVEVGDEVITQPLTFIATCNAISYVGAHPVFVDIDPEVLSLSPEALERWLVDNARIDANGRCVNKSTGRRIAAVVPMHTFGMPARLDELVDLCHRWHIPLVEDAAESIGSLYHGRHTGTFGRVGAMSFNGNKTITTGGGGMLLFDDEALGARAKHLTTQAKVPHRWEFDHDAIGYNYRMPNINAALGCAQLEQIDAFVADKRDTARCYAEFFAPIEGVRFITEPEGCRSNYWLNAVMMRTEAEARSLIEYTNNHGVVTRPAWRLMCDLPMFASAQTGPLDVSRSAATRLVNLPSSVKA